MKETILATGRLVLESVSYSYQPASIARVARASFLLAIWQCTTWYQSLTLPRCAKDHLLRKFLATSDQLLDYIHPHTSSQIDWPAWRHMV